jgi:probable HAF family extracellular repeat protein
LWSKETGIQDLGTLPGGFTSVALGINENGDIVGISLDAAFNPTAYLRPAGGMMVDLNSLIPADSPLFLFDACSINSRGEIIGIALDAAGNNHGFLATPSNTAADSADISSANNRAQFDTARKLLLQRLEATGSAPSSSSADRTY